ncbi:MAG: pyridoxamine 5-phosphate oxidase [Methanospirillum sp.]|nr:pyridoxamine 5-phosphate oxidase [Methanospirillum sp.]
MVLISDEVKAVFEKNRVFSVATAGRDGTPNVVPIAFVEIKENDQIWIGDNYMKKTLANVLENPRMAIFAYDPDSKQCFQVKGRVDVRTEGPEYKQVRAKIRAKKETYPAKSLLILTVEEVYSCTPGAGAGDRIA